MHLGLYSQPAWFNHPPMPPSRSERLAALVQRLKAAPPAQTFEEARQQLSDILNAVEDEMTDIPFSPAAWQSDGRMYPPQDDFERSSGNPAWRRFRSKLHNLL